MLNKKIYKRDLRTRNELILSESASLLKILYRFFLSLSTKNGEEWRRRLASTAIAQFNGQNSVEIKFEIFFSVRLMFRGHLQWQSDLDLRFISGENLGFEDQKVGHL